MSHRIIVLAAVLALGVSAPAAAQTTNAPPQAQKIILKGPAPKPAPANTEAAAVAKAPFGCNARAPNVCHFRIFFGRRSRDVVLPAGMKVAIPDVRIGTDTYCVVVNTKPVHTCARKAINARYNS